MTERGFNIDEPHEQRRKEKRAFYNDVIHILEEEGVRYGVIGGYAQHCYGGTRRPSADFDIAIEPSSVGFALHTLNQRGLRTEYKHPAWLNQVWSAPSQLDGSSHSIDFIHGHSTGLSQVQPWWIDEGTRGSYKNSSFNLAAPEAVALSKVLLWSRRAHDMPDAVQIVHGVNIVFRPFDWNLLLDNLYSDWRLGYALAVETELIYGKSSEHCIKREIKERLHGSLTQNPIPSPVRGHIFAYDLSPNAGNEAFWKASGQNPLAIDSPTDDIWTAMSQWNTEPMAMPRASTLLANQHKNIDWEEFINITGENWRLALNLVLYTDVLFGKEAEKIIPHKVKTHLSEKFLETTPNDGGLGKELFPDRF